VKPIETKYNKLCEKCVNNCKQEKFMKVIRCPLFKPMGNTKKEN
jgi:hypothetical protein